MPKADELALVLKRTGADISVLDLPSLMKVQEGSMTVHSAEKRSQKRPKTDASTPVLFRTKVNLSAFDIDIMAYGHLTFRFLL